MKNAVKILMLLVLLSLLVACGSDNHSFTYQARMNDFKAHRPEAGMPMMVGDSITYLFGMQVTWPTGWTNRGITGDTVKGVRDRMDYHIAERPGEIVLLIGANNYNTDPKDFIGVLFSIVEKVYAANIPLTIVGELPQQLSDRSERMKQFDTAIRAMCEQHNIRYVPVYDYFTKDGTFNQDLFADTVHPNADGYKVMRSIFENNYVIHN